MTNKEAAQIVYSVMFMLDKEYYSDAVEEALQMAIKALEERSIAMWEYVQYGSPKIGNFHCSNCRYIAINHKLSEYCPHCGARMEGIDA